MATFREIEFENNSPKVCFSGQLLKGRANIYFPVDTRVKGDDFVILLSGVSVALTVDFVRYSNLHHIFW